MKLEFQNVTKTFGAQRVINNLTATLEFPHALAFIGPSGGGKSTLLRMIAGLVRPDAGTILIDGEPLPTTRTLLRSYRSQIGTVFQAYNLFPHLTARENIVLPLVHVHGLPRTEALTRANDILSRFQLADHATKRPAELSGGQRQRVAIARGVAIRPRLLLFDEPTSALDPEMTAEVLDLILDLKSAGRPLILVSHQMGFVQNASDQVAFIAQGGILESGETQMVFANPTRPETTRFLQTVLKY